MPPFGGVYDTFSGLGTLFKFIGFLLSVTYGGLTIFFVWLTTIIAKRKGFNPILWGGIAAGFWGLLPCGFFVFYAGVFLLLPILMAALPAYIVAALPPKGTRKYDPRTNKPFWHS